MRLYFDKKIIVIFETQVDELCMQIEMAKIDIVDVNVYVKLIELL